MLDEDSLRLEAQSFTLGLGRVDKDAAGNEHTGNSPTLNICDVVHTARRAAASIGERFDHRITVGGDLVAQVDRGRL